MEKGKCYKEAKMEDLQLGDVVLDENGKALGGVAFHGGYVYREKKGAGDIRLAQRRPLVTDTQEIYITIKELEAIADKFCKQTKGAKQ